MQQVTHLLYNMLKDNYWKIKIMKHNRMGIVNCSNEQYGKVGSNISDDPEIDKHLGKSWYQIIMNIFFNFYHLFRSNNPNMFYI